MRERRAESRRRRCRSPPRAPSRPSRGTGARVGARPPGGFSRRSPRVRGPRSKELLRELDELPLLRADVVEAHVREACTLEFVDLLAPRVRIVAEYERAVEILLADELGDSLEVTGQR